MKHGKLRWITGFVVLLIVLCCLSISMADEIASGICGESITWTLDDKGTLTISGSGEIAPSDPNYPWSGYSWTEYAGDISSVVIEEGVTGIREYAFYNCHQLTAVTIPASVASIDMHAMHDCCLLNAVQVNPKNPYFSDIDGVLFNQDQTEIVWYPQARTGVYTIPSGVKRIGDLAFFYCSITDVTIPSSVTEIGYAAFFGCSNLTGIDIPDSVISIGFESFRFCSSMTSVRFPKDLGYIPGAGFEGCTSLTEITIPEKVTVIYDYAFRDCTNLTSISVPGRLRYIFHVAFENCTSLSRVYFSGSERSWDLLYIAEGNECFTDAEIELGFPGASGTWGNLSWKLDSSGTLTISGSGEMQGFKVYNDGGSFSIDLREWHDYSPEILSAVVGKGITNIGEDAFEACLNLKKVSIPDTVTSVDEDAFRECSGLSSISIPGSVTAIKYCAFVDCQNLANVTICNREAVIDSLVFENCASPLYLHGHTGSTAETYANNNSYITFVALAEMDTPDFTLPAYLTAIEAEAFSGSKATVVYIPDGVTSLGSKAFANCTNLTQIRIPASVTVIPPDLFYGLTATQIKSITVFSTPGSVAETYANGKGMKFEVE